MSVPFEDHIVQGGKGKIVNRFEEQLGRSEGYFLPPFDNT
jgi:hypothetical protein